MDFLKIIFYFIYKTQKFFFFLSIETVQNPNNPNSFISNIRFNFQSILHNRENLDF